MTLRLRTSFLFYCLLGHAYLSSREALSLFNPQQPKISRRDAIFFGTATTLATLTSITFLNKDTRPIDHEKRVYDTFNRAVKEAAMLSSPLALSDYDTTTERKTFHILELGIGSKWQTVKRGLYNQTLLNNIISNNDNNSDQNNNAYKINKNILITGVDLLEMPKLNVQKLEETVFKNHDNDSSSTNILQQPYHPIQLNTIQGNICSKLPYPDGYFDVITCCFALCSVENQSSALQEIKRLLKNKGTFGFVEHVAVQEDDNYEWLENQQIFFDPLQQIVADNCHLHRDTDIAILDMFGRENVKEYERFFINSMWPISCQSCGVIVKA